MKFIFRVDASDKIGSGHVMRCLTLADYIKKRGADIYFISRANKGNLNALISQKGIKVIELSKPISKEITHNKSKGDKYGLWLGVSREQDACETKNILSTSQPDWIIVDHYALGEDWEKEIRPFVKNIMVIDDLANRTHDCDLLLDQNWFKDKDSRYDGLVPVACTKLLGPEYALLRPEFSQARKTLKMRNGKVERIFVFFGGVDSNNLTAMTLRALSEPELSHLEVDVVIGEKNTRREKIQKIVESRELTHLYIQVDDIAAIMAKADLAIGAGGVNTWERICLDLFSIVITTANNQLNTIKDLSDQKYIKYLGKKQEVDQDIISAHIKRYVYNAGKVKNNKMLLDVMGTNRVAEVLLNNYGAD